MSKLDFSKAISLYFLGLLPSSLSLAQEAAPKGPSTLEMFVMPVGFILIFYFLIMRPQQKKAKDLADLISGIKVGDEVVTAGGIIGKVRSISDSFVTLELSGQASAKVLKTAITGQTKEKDAKPT